MTATVTPLRTRRPTCKTAWPRIALTGPGGSGKSYQLALLSGSEHVGRLLWMELVERKADEYGLVPGANYEIIEHSGDYHDIVAQLTAAREAAREAVARGDKPWVLAVDSISTLWEMLKGWADGRARDTEKAKAILRRDPNADIKVSMNLWEDAGKRWRTVMTLLLTFPGIVVVTAKGRMVTAMEDGAPAKDGHKEYKIEARQGFDHDMFQIVRLSPDEAPLVVKNNSVHNGIAPGSPPVPAPNFTLEWFIFDILKVATETSAVPDTPNMTAGAPLEDELPPPEEEQPAQPRGDDQPQWGRQQQPAVPRPARRTAQQNQEYAAAGAAKMLAAATPEDLAPLVAKANDDPSGLVNVSGLLNDGQRAELAVNKGDRLPLKDLAALVLAYVEAEGYSVDNGVAVAAEQIKAAS